MMPAKTAAMEWLTGRKSEAGEAQRSTYLAGRPKMPKDLPPEAAAEWKRVVRELYKRGTMTRVDGSLLELYCWTYLRWRNCLKDVTARGEVIEQTYEQGTRVVQNPAGRLATQLGNSLRAMLKELSATPITRERARPAAPSTSKPVEYEPGSMGWHAQQKIEHPEEFEEERHPDEQQRPDSTEDAGEPSPDGV